MITRLTRRPYTVMYTIRWISIAAFGLFLSAGSPIYCFSLLGADMVFSLRFLSIFLCKYCSCPFVFSHAPYRDGVYAVDGLPCVHALADCCRSPSGGLPSQGASLSFRRTDLTASELVTIVVLVAISWRFQCLHDTYLVCSTVVFVFVRYPEERGVILHLAHAVLQWLKVVCHSLTCPSVDSKRRYSSQMAPPERAIGWHNESHKCTGSTR